ncbi:MAG: M48 family metallopeptidase [Candidatus Bathyarchaeia archaeon]
MGRLSFHDEIARNKLNSILLASIVSLVVFAMVYVLVYLFAPEFVLAAVPLSILLIVLYAYGSYMYGDAVVLASTGAQPAEGRQYQHLRDAVEGLSIAAGIPPPKVYVVESDEMNAFATGRDPEHASVTVTTGLLRGLDRLELEGVLAHEISHIRNRDILFMTLVAVLVGLAAVLSHIILRTFRYGGVRGGRRERRGGVGLLAIFAPIVTRLVQFAVSRRREFLADASGVELTRYSEGLASALEKIKMRNRGEMDVSEAVSHLFFVDPNRSPLDRLYATHPPIEERIRRLRAM